ncbi:MAG: flagellar export protein FliJ [Lachnospiraceae bacterium]|jgi:flagellar FliJ protein|nr:flagellar export protein FliJ [Lachnospiraceae bacterium]
MGRFVYRLQGILDIKEKMESRARQQYASAKAALDQEEERLAALYAKRALYQEEGVRLRKGSLKIHFIAENERAIESMTYFITEQTKRVESCQRATEEARQELSDVMKERKTYESLREKALEDFHVEENRQESKEVDELTSYTYGMRKSR